MLTSKKVEVNGTEKDRPVPRAGKASASAPISGAETLGRPIAESSHGLAPGVVLASRFRIVSLLGRGGMGEVYRAEDLKLGQAVALKFLPDPIDQAKLRRFYAEVRLGRQVAHPNVCRIYDVIEAEARHFLVMEYVDGEDLASLLRRIGRLPQDKGLEIARGLCAGLAAAHERGILHRDLKPANVMIDGRGHPRIMDFGLAVLAGETQRDERAGTPAYMAPEQLKGEELTVRTDIYSLGLVLYEVFTGRRAWAAASMPELLRAHSDSAPTAPSSLVPELDRGVERVIMSCLAREPTARPSTALAVQAALPGGDPLQAALALGETPSPQMVAAAAVVGDLRPRAAWACLAAALLAFFGVLWLSERVMLHRLVPLQKAPEVLLDRARTIAALLAPDEPIADSAWGLEVDWDYFGWIAERDASPGKWRRLATERPGPLLFWYRASREPLAARTWVAQSPWIVGVRQVGRVTRDQPAPTAPGMQEILLDMSGRLLEWQRVSARYDSKDADVEATLATLFAESGLQQAKFKRELSGSRGPDASGWRGVFADSPGQVRVEAALHHGRVASFAVVRHDVTVDPGLAIFLRAISESMRGFALGAVALFALPAWAGILTLVVRNLRLKRGDRRGALWIGLFGAATGAAALKLGTHFPPSLYDALDLWVASDAQAVYWAGLGWIFYMALEPELRRTWPHTLIAWSRLLSGRVRDPLVGRDVLLGVTAGLLLVCLGLGANVASAWLGGVPLAGAPVPALASGREALAILLQWSYPSVLGGAVSLLVLLLMFRFTRSRPISLFLLWLGTFIVLLGGLAPSSSLNTALSHVWMLALGVALAVFVVYRLGLVSTALMIYVLMVVPRVPLTTDWTAWYAGSSALGLAVVIALLVYGFFVSLGGKPLFGPPVLES